jgi:hypothetical protein
MKLAIAVAGASTLLAAAAFATAFAQNPGYRQEVRPMPVVGNDYMMRLSEKATATRDFRQPGNPLEHREAEAFATAAGVPCKVTEAAVVTRRNGLAYEIACEKDFGWVVTKLPSGVYTAYDCLALEASAKAIGKGKDLATCRLRNNVGHQIDGLQNLAAKAKLSCSVVDGEFKGSGGAPPIARYEIACKDAGGYLIDAPTPGSKADLATATCAQAASIGAACTLKR